jgi:hypothetical protein
MMAAIELPFPFAAGLRRMGIQFPLFAAQTDLARMANILLPAMRNPDGPQAAAIAASWAEPGAEPPEKGTTASRVVERFRRLSSVSK